MSAVATHGPAPAPPIRLTGALLALAAFLPCLMAVEYGPVVGQLQEQVSYGLWAMLMIVVAWRQPAPTLMANRPTVLLVGLLMLLAVWALVQCSVALQAPQRGLMSFFYLAAAAAVVCSGALAARVLGPSAMRWLLAGLLAAGLVNAGIALVQVLSPLTADDVWIAQGFVAGRANGNLRQPNQLAALLLLSLIALWALWPASRRATAWAGMLAVPLLLGVVLSASRFGLACTVLVILHGIARPWAPDLRRRATMALLTLAMLWLAGWWLASSTGAGLAINDRLSHETASGSRWPLWHAALSMIKAHPWIGAGWGEFNRVWMLTAKTLPTPHAFSNAHNLPLQWATELGLPMALVACAVLLWAWWSLWRQAADAGLSASDLALRRAVALMATVLLLYSLIEYPLWFSRFLFPLCFAVGWAGHDATARAIALPAWKGLTAALLLAVLAAHADYRSTAALQHMNGQTAQQQEDRVAQARRSFLFSGPAFRATALSMRNDPMAAAAVAYAAQDYLDLKLMEVWAESFDAAGQPAYAQYLMDRMVEMGAPSRQGGCSRAGVEAAHCRERAQRLTPDDFR